MVLMNLHFTGLAPDVWCGAVAALKLLPKTRATVRATNPTHRPQQFLAEGFLNAVILPRRMALTISAGIHALATSCANSQNNSLSPQLRQRERPAAAPFFELRTLYKSHVGNDLCGWLVMQNLLRDWIHEVLVACDVDPSTLLVSPPPQNNTPKHEPNTFQTLQLAGGRPNRAQTGSDWSGAATREHLPSMHSLFDRNRFLQLTRCSCKLHLGNHAKSTLTRTAPTQERTETFECPCKIWQNCAKFANWQRLICCGAKSTTQNRANKSPNSASKEAIKSKCEAPNSLSKWILTVFLLSDNNGQNSGWNVNITRLNDDKCGNCDEIYGKKRVPHLLADMRFVS